MNELEAVLFGKAIGDLTRQKILKFCCCCEKSVGEIAEHVEVTQPTASHHLSVLQEAGLTTRREEGKMAYYVVNQDAVLNCCGQILLRIAPDKKKAHQIYRCCD